jgi:ETC complex I subunit conserved region
MRNDDLNLLWRSSMGPDHPSGVSAGMPQHKGEDNILPRNTLPFAQRAFPPDAMATIYRPARSAMTSGTANTRRWKLRFEPRTAPFVEPLMGWTGGTDTLSQVELDFPSAEAAVAYAKRQGLNFVVQGPAEATQDRCPAPDKSKPGDRDRRAAQACDFRSCTRKLEWVERTLEPRVTNDGIDLDRALANPAAAFDEPERVVRQSKLSHEQKREILRRWALDAHRTARTDFSRLDKVIDALIDLDEPEGLVIKRREILSNGARAA